MRPVLACVLLTACVGVREPLTFNPEEVEEVRYVDLDEIANPDHVFGTPCDARTITPFCNIDGMSGAFVITDSCGHYVGAMKMNGSDLELFCGLLPTDDLTTDLEQDMPMPPPKPEPPPEP